jgi:hypothetical protein
MQNARWWDVRPAQSLQPKTYVCPFCDGLLHATSDHSLVVPEGDLSKRRHAHTDCVLAARKRGELPLADEWKRANRPPDGRRLRRRR